MEGRTRAFSMDDSSVDYTSILDQEDMVRRWSEDVVDLELRDSVRLNKLYRQLQRQVYCRNRDGARGGATFVSKNDVTEDLLKETDRLRRHSLSTRNIQKRRKRSSTMRRVLLKQTVVEKNSSCIRICEDDESEPEIQSVATSSSTLLPVNRSTTSSLDSTKAREKSTARAIITGGTMTIILLAASLVTTTFLMSPVIEEFLDKANESSQNLSTSFNTTNV